ncbi:TetR family transcriptional regulator [Micromonospora sp. CPCC 205371]|nr:TetR family transcriptional regulator [Micromonospora sp. CPCC 205371]
MTGLRERKKAATRQALHEAALRLAAEHGVDRLTIEAIADAATVSRRTFSNYFASKEQALLHADQVRLARLLELVDARPSDEPAWAALTAAVERMTAEEPFDNPEQLERYRQLHHHPAMLSEMIATYAAAERDLAGAIARRLPAGPETPLRARLLAASFLTAARVANELWLEDPSQPLPDLVRRTLTLIREPFA